MNISSLILSNCNGCLVSLLEPFLSIAGAKLGQSQGRNSKPSTEIMFKLICHIYFTLRQGECGRHNSMIMLCPVGFQEVLMGLPCHADLQEYSSSILNAIWFCPQKWHKCLWGGLLGFCCYKNNIHIFSYCCNYWGNSSKSWEMGIQELSPWLSGAALPETAAVEAAEQIIAVFCFPVDAISAPVVELLPSSTKAHLSSQAQSST